MTSGERNMDDSTQAAPPQAADDATTSARLGRTRTAFEEALRPLAITGMLACLAYSLSQFIGSVASVWPGRAFVGLACLVSLESIHSWRMLVRQDSTTMDRIRFRFVEWIVIILLARFVVYIDLGGERLVSDLSRWSLHIGALFDATFVVTVMMAAVVWWLALLLARAFRELDAQSIERRSSPTDPQSYLYETMPHHGLTDRQAILKRISGIVFGGGMILLLLAGLSRVDVRDLITLQHGRSSGIIVNVLVYFVLGFLLMSQARYSILRAQWELHDIPILGNIGKRWAIMALAFLGLVALLAAVLPVGYSVGILETLSIALRWIVYLMLQIVFFVVYIFSLLFSLIMGLFRSSEAPSPTRQQAPPPPVPADAPSGGSPWWPLVRSLIFWTVTAGIIGYSLYHFVGYRSELLKRLSIYRLLAWIGWTWAKLRRAIGGTARSLQTRIRQEIARRREARRAKGQRPWHYISLRRMTPRERIRFFYLSMLYRARKQGFGRPPALTPCEFEHILQAELQLAEQEIAALTAAFLEARYSEHSVDQREARGAQQTWRRVRRSFAARRRLGRSASKAEG